MAINKIANTISTIFFTLEFSINLRIELPNNTQTLIEGKFTSGANPAKKNNPVINCSSLGKKTLTAVIATTQAFGFKI